jgi:K+/H+ antiporter YhaU regulatory subunit KhtT
MGRVHDDRTMATRRFPAPWRAEKMPGGYVVRDSNDQAIAYVYSRANVAEAMQAKVLTEDEARRIAANIAKLPVLLKREE